VDVEFTKIAMESPRSRPDVLSTPLSADEVDRLLGLLAAAGIPARHEVGRRDTYDYTGHPCVSEEYSVFLVPGALAERAREVLWHPTGPGG
jgi:hypothetical protein